MARAVVFAPQFIGQEPERGSVGSLGPGAYEALRVSLRRRHQRDHSRPAKTKEKMVWNEQRQRFDWKEVRRFSYTRDDERDPIIARVTGYYTVYCGEGWEHTIRVDQTEWVYPGGDWWDLAYSAWKDHDANAAAELAAELVEHELEDWSDPCNEIPDECPLCGFDLAKNDYPTTHKADGDDDCVYVLEGW
jgi:hypothetical protein